MGKWKGGATEKRTGGGNKKMHPPFPAASMDSRGWSDPLVGRVVGRKRSGCRFRLFPPFILVFIRHFGRRVHGVNTGDFPEFPRLFFPGPRLLPAALSAKPKETNTGSTVFTLVFPSGIFGKHRGNSNLDRRRLPPPPNFFVLRGGWKKNSAVDIAPGPSLEESSHGGSLFVFA